MAKERVLQHRNTGTADAPVWEKYYPQTVADAVLMSDSDAETTNIKEYVDTQVAALVNGAPETLDTLKEIADAIAENEDVVEGLNAAIGNKADATHTHAIADVTNLQGTLDAKADKAYASVKIGEDVVVEADGKAAQLEIEAGSGVALEKNATTGAIVITATGEAVSDEALTAQKLKTARTIGMDGAVTAVGVAFDGSADVTITATDVDATKLTGTVPAANLPDGSTAAKGAVQLSSATNSTSETLAATPAAVKAAYDAATAAQTAADSKAAIYFADTLPTSAPVGSICFLTVS